MIPMHARTGEPRTTDSPTRRAGELGARALAVARLCLASLSLTALSLTALSLTTWAGAQPAFDQMEDLIERGYYNSAAQLNGPELVAAYPNDARAHYLYAWALYLTGDVSGARARLEEALRLTDAAEDADLTHLNGLLRAAEGDAEGALRALQNAFVRSGEYDHAMDWGRIAWQLGRYQEALQAFEAAATTPEGATSLWPHLNRGRILLYLEEIELAIDALRRALSIFEAADPGGSRPPSPGYVEAFFRLGQAFEALGMLEEAESHYRSARSTDPNYIPAATALDRLSRRSP